MKLKLNLLKPFLDIIEDDAVFEIETEVTNDRRRLIDMSHIYEEIPAVELTFEYEHTNDILATLRNHQILTVKNCPSMIAALSSITLFMRGFFVRFWSALCLHFVINDDVKELNEIKFLKFFNSLNGFSKSFMIVFESSRDNSCLFYWRLKDTLQIFSLLTIKNSVRFGDFVKDFLFQSLKKGKNGEN